MIAVGAPFASALAVTYTTTGVFSVNDVSQTNLPGAPNFTDYVSYFAAGAVVPGHATPASVTVNAPASPAVVQGSLGDIFVADASGSTLDADGTFTLTINQIAPAGTGNFGANTSAAVFSGSVSRQLHGQQNFDTLMLTFDETSVNIAGVEYSINGLTGIDDNQLDLNLYDNQITADISQLPEPTFVALTGLGFAGLCFVAFRRRRSA
jgi:hypothetical protein